MPVLFFDAEDADGDLVSYSGGQAYSSQFKSNIDHKIQLTGDPGCATNFLKNSSPGFKAKHDWGR